MFLTMVESTRDRCYSAKVDISNRDLEHATVLDANKESRLRSK